VKTFWEKEASGLLKSLMARHEVSCKGLVTRLEKLGIPAKERSLRNKIDVGKFSLIFFIQCLHALGYTEARFALTPFKRSESKDSKDAPKQTGRRLER
jgi:hypothetical protein